MQPLGQARLDRDREDRRRRNIENQVRAARATAAQESTSGPLVVAEFIPGAQTHRSLPHAEDVPPRVQVPRQSSIALGAQLATADMPRSRELIRRMFGTEGRVQRSAPRTGSEQAKLESPGPGASGHTTMAVAGGGAETAASGAIVPHGAEAQGSPNCKQRRALTRSAKKSAKKGGKKNRNKKHAMAAVPSSESGRNAAAVARAAFSSAGIDSNASGEQEAGTCDTDISECAITPPRPHY